MGCCRVKQSIYRLAMDVLTMSGRYFTLTFVFGTKSILLCDIGLSENETGAACSRFILVLPNRHLVAREHVGSVIQRRDCLRRVLLRHQLRPSHEVGP